MGNMNPTNMIMSTLSGNPQFSGILNALKTGVSPKDLFYQTASNMGIDPQSVIDALSK